MKNERYSRKIKKCNIFHLLMIAFSAVLSSCGTYSLDYRYDYDLRINGHRISGGSERNKDVEKHTQHTQPVRTAAGVIHQKPSINNTPKSLSAPPAPQPPRDINIGSSNPTATYKAWRQAMRFLLMRPTSLKEEPTNNSGNIVHLNTGDKVVIIGERGNWARARHTPGSMQEGWIRFEGMRAIDFEDQYFKRYFHFILILFGSFWWVFLLLFVVPLLVLSFLFLPKTAAGWATAICLSFTIIGAIQGSLYWSATTNIHSSALLYMFVNLFYVPLFFVFHGGILPYFIILCVSIKEHGLARKANLALASRRKEIEKRSGYEVDEIESVSAYWESDEVAEKNKLHNLNKEGIMLPDMTGAREKMKAIGQYFLDKSKDGAPTFDVEYLEGVKARFLTQFKFISKGENEKLNLLIQHVNGLIEYERARNRLEHVESEKHLDDARRYTEYKKLQAECMRHELEIVKLTQEMGKVKDATPVDPIKELKEKLCLERKKKEVYLDNRIKMLHKECASNIKLKGALRKLRAEETVRICGGKEREDLKPEQLQELEDMEDYIQNEIDRL